MRLAKLSLFSPATESRATVDISDPASMDLSERPVSMENRVTMPTPPTHAVEIRQN